MATTDSVRLRVSRQEYLQSIQTLDQHLNTLRKLILPSYERLKQEGYTYVMGSNDSNARTLMAGIDKNIAAVKGAINQLDANKKELERQNTNLGLLSESVNQAVATGITEGVDAFAAIKAIKDEVGSYVD